MFKKTSAAHILDSIDNWNISYDSPVRASQILSKINEFTNEPKTKHLNREQCGNYSKLQCYRDSLLIWSVHCEHTKKLERFFLQKHTYFFVAYSLIEKTLLWETWCSENEMSAHSVNTHQSHTAHACSTWNMQQIIYIYFYHISIFGASLAIIRIIFFFHYNYFHFVHFRYHFELNNFLLPFHVHGMNSIIFLCINLAFSPKFDTFCIHYSEGTLNFRSS